jgi:RNA polymerase sigma factor (sigma-70 family)
MGNRAYSRLGGSVAFPGSERPFREHRQFRSIDRDKSTVISERVSAIPRYLSDLLRNGTPAALSDSELLNRFAARRSEDDETAELAFAALLARHGPMVLRVCRVVLGDQHEVEDAFQATFLVLAVRARSIRRRGSVASWLHGVALRVAAAERSRAVRRRRHELLAGAVTSTTTDKVGSDPVCDRELTLIVQEEIGRLPEKYRAAVVLCYLEGLTHEMAAEKLGWPVGSVKSRLAWARERLRVRLTRRGVAPTFGSFDRSPSVRDSESSPIPVLLGTRLMDATLRGALKAGMGRGALVGTVSAEAVALMESVIKSMTHSKLMLVLAAVLVAGMLTVGVGVIGHSANRQDKPAIARDRGQEPPREVVVSQVKQDPPRAAGAKPAADQGPLTLQVEVVDPEGRRLPEADVVVMVAYARSSGLSEPVVERIRTDGAGRVRLDVAPERSGARAFSASLWAYQPGRAVAVKNVSFTRGASPSVIPLTLDQPAWCTITVFGPDDRPIAGLRVSPHLLRRTDRPNPVPQPPDEWAQQLGVTTDAKGVATLSCLPGTMMPLSVRVAGPGVAPHSLALEMREGRNAFLKLGRSGRVVGIVRTESGVPLADVPVELWVQGADIRRSDFGASLPSRRITSDEILRLEQGPLKTGSQGAFQAPSTLLFGSTYRVSIRQDGFVPFFSDWVTLNGERDAIPPIHLKPLKKFAGQIKDRQGRAVVGARVFLPAGGLETVTDAQGRFALVGVKAGKAIILVEQTGFRLRGWLIDPSSQADVGSLTLERASEGPGPVMKPLADPIPPAESRALAERLLEPYVHDPVENENDEPRLYAILALCELDLDRALALLKNSELRDGDRLYSLVREYVAAKVAENDGARAVAMIESIPDPAAKVSAIAKVAKALPASERGRKQALLERATPLLKDGAQRANDADRLRLVSAIAEQWLDIGERERAELMLEEGKTSSNVFQTGYLGQLARLEPDQAMAQLQKQPTFSNPSRRDDEVTAIAVQLATDHPADAERFFNLRDSRTERFPGTDTLRLCSRLARVDPTRARRVAASLGGPGIRACAWAYIALGLAEKDKAGASEAMDRAIQEIDRLRESGLAIEPVSAVGGVLLLYPTNPAVVILPIVERISPERLDEVFWRAVTLHIRIKADQEDQLARSNIGFECMLLARYDRQVAAVLFEPVNSYLRSLAARTGPRDEFDPSVITALGCIDPRSAVAIVESLTPPKDYRRPHPALQARRRLAEVLGMPIEKRWMRLWLVRFDD